MPSPWDFHLYGEAGTPVSDLFPHIATQVDDIAIVRSMTAKFMEHAQGNLIGILCTRGYRRPQVPHARQARPAGGRCKPSTLLRIIPAPSAALRRHLILEFPIRSWSRPVHPIRRIRRLRPRPDAVRGSIRLSAMRGPGRTCGRASAFLARRPLAADPSARLVPGARYRRGHRLPRGQPARQSRTVAGSGIRLLPQLALGLCHAMVSGEAALNAYRLAAAFTGPRRPARPS